MITGLDHIGIAVENLEEVLPIFEQFLELKLEKTKEAKEHGIRAATIVTGGIRIELMEPLSRSSPISRFIEKRGQGIHHLAFTVVNVEKALRRLEKKGMRLIDTEPRIGLDGGRIAFLHPKGTGNVLIELCENPGKPE